MWFSQVLSVWRALQIIGSCNRDEESFAEVISRQPVTNVCFHRPILKSSKNNKRKRKGNNSIYGMTEVLRGGKRTIFS